MTPEERNLVMDLFNRLATLENAPRDAEAERLIEDGLRYAPHAPYALVQTVLVQDEALKRAESRIRELEAGAEGRDSGFLGSMRDSLFGRREGRASVPSVPSGEVQSGTSSAWQTGTQPMAGGPGAAPMQPGAGGGGSFLGTAAAAAAGVIGGSMLLGGIRSLMGQPGSAHAAYDPSGARDSDPWSGGGSGGDLSRQVGLDDVGRSSAGEAGGRRGLLDQGQADEAAKDPTGGDFGVDDFDFEDDPDDFDDVDHEEE
jgi:uncharacterized protein